MKLFKILLSLLFVTALFTSCTHDELLIPGPAGQDGIDGIDGVDGTASCVSCHSNATRDPVFASFELSVHNTGGSWVRGTIGSCAQCHGNEGYVDYVTTGMSDPAGYPDITPIVCSTCHDQHTSFDFENDGQDYALRSFGPVTLVLDTNVTLDFGDASNNCITCHQPRNSYVIPTGSGDYEITSKRFGPHHGPQSTMLEGIMGAEIAGDVDYPSVGSSTHRTGASCVSCHMGESDVVSEGLHSWVPTEASCISCHSNGVPTEASGFTEDMETLAALLDANNMFDEDGYYNEGTYSVELAQAAWNYRTLLEDNSRGIHNPGYTKALLANSIQALQD